MSWGTSRVSVCLGWMCKGQGKAKASVHLNQRVSVGKSYAFKTQCLVGGVQALSEFLVVIVPGDRSRCWGSLREATEETTSAGTGAKDCLDYYHLQKHRTGRQEGGRSLHASRELGVCGCSARILSKNCRLALIWNFIMGLKREGRDLGGRNRGLRERWIHAW